MQISWVPGHFLNQAQYQIESGPNLTGKLATSANQTNQRWEFKTIIYIVGVFLTSQLEYVFFPTLFGSDPKIVKSDSGREVQCNLDLERTFQPIFFNSAGFKNK